ncbi:hypothetical protein CLOM_g14675, partial [Closterium sp. NIES-68]
PFIFTNTPSATFSPRIVA